MPKLDRSDEAYIGSIHLGAGTKVIYRPIIEHIKKNPDMSLPKLIKGALLMYKKKYM